VRVLMLHNRYRLPGGEERAVGDISALLAANGHQVELLERSSGEAGRRRAAQALVVGGEDPGEVSDRVRRFKPDVVHIHNIHPLFGWRALAAAKAGGARTVFHLHNFRLFCAIGVAYRDGAVCFRCRGRDTRPGLRFRCRGSTGEAVAYAIGLHIQQPRLFQFTDRFITVSEAHSRRLFELGLQAAPTRTLSNFARTRDLASGTRAGDGAYALASGRLVEEKGFDTAIAAARQAAVPLIIAGDGPDQDRLRGLAAGGDVRFTGRVAEPALAELRRGAGMVLIPSRSEEAFPYAGLDALAAGVPVLASGHGGLPELVGSESVLAADDRQAWARRVRQLWDDPQERRRLGSAGLERVRSRFSERAYLEALIDIYSGDR
jgi:glycosyltransferase involved in cell wall biosynthesis